MVHQATTSFLRGVLRPDSPAAPPRDDAARDDRALDDTAGIPVITDAALPPAPDGTAYAGMANWQQLRASWRHARRMAREAGSREGSRWHEIQTTPVSPQIARQYAESRCWVPVGDDGGFAESSGTAYFNWYALPKINYHCAQVYKLLRPTRVIAWAAARNALIIALLAAGSWLTHLDWLLFATWAFAGFTVAPLAPLALLLAAGGGRPREQDDDADEENDQ